MKNIKTLGTLGIRLCVITLVASMAFFSCGGGGGGGESLSGTVEIQQYGSAVTEDVNVGSSLTAEYNGTETDITYQWKKDGVNVSADKGGTSKIFAPAEPGKYTVTVRAPGKKAVTSGQVTVVGEALLELEAVSIVKDGSPVTTAQTGDTLTAFYSGVEVVAFQWFKDGVALQTYPSSTNGTWKPVEPGSYTVKISLAGYGDRISTAVVVTGESLITITFDLNGPSGIQNPTRTIAPGEEITAREVLPSPPEYNGFTFRAWYIKLIDEDEVVTWEELENDTVFDVSTTVYALWTFGGGTPYYDAETDTVIHENPLMEEGTGFAGAISEEDGTISYTAGSFDYRWPYSSDFNIGDYAYCVMRYELKSATGNASGVRLYRRGTTTPYPGITNTSPWLSNGTSFRFVLRGSSDTVGFSIQFGGTSGTPIRVRVLSITFHKLALHTVSFDNNGGDGGNPSSVTIFDGETFVSMGETLPATPTRSDGDYTFMGWEYPVGTVVTNTTPIGGSWELKAAWILTADLPKPIDEVDPATGTLFAATGGSSATKLEYDGKEWWVMAKTGPEYGTVDPVPVPPFDDTESDVFDAAVAAAKRAYTRISYNLPSLDAKWSSYPKVTLTYDLVILGGDNLVVTTRNGLGAGGDPNVAGAPASLEEGTGVTLTLNTSAISTGNLAFVKGNYAEHTNSIFLLRITKVELHVDR